MSGTSLFFGFILLALVIGGIFMKLPPAGRARMVAHASTQWKLLTIITLVVIAVGMVLVWSPWVGVSGEAPSPKTVWEFTKTYWLWIVLILGIPFFALFIVGESWAKVLQGLLFAVVAMFFVVIPLVHVIWGEKTPSTQAQQQTCPQSKSTDVHQCMVTESGIQIMTGESINPDEFQFCGIQPEGRLIEFKWLSPSTLLVKSKNGTFLFDYKWVSKSVLLDGKCPNRF